MEKPVLYSYFRSSCSWRVRIVLKWKDIEYEYRPIHLVSGEQHGKEFHTINPLGQVPALVLNSQAITQSVAIMEFLEETYPQNALLPKDLMDRAKVRQIVEMINAGTQPIQNLSVLKKVSDEQESRQEWAAFWIEKGLQGVEKVLVKSAGKYCVGDDVSFADCCLVPQVFNANRFKVPMEQFPMINRIVSNLENMEAFKAAHPSRQPDTPEELKMK